MNVQHRMMNKKTNVEQRMVDEENEILGLDNTIHGERAFEID